MPPKRIAVTVKNGSPAKRQRRVGVIGAPSQADDTARLIAAHHLAEHAGQGQSYLSRRSITGPSGATIPSLSSISLQISAEGLVDLLKLPAKSGADATNPVSSVGWNKDRDMSAAAIRTEEADALREYVKSLPEATANRLLASVVERSAHMVENSSEVGGIAVSTR